MQPSDESSPAPYPETTAEQAATVRRIGIPIGIAGAICGMGSLVLLLIRYFSPWHPNALLAVNLSFCAMMMGIGILFYVRRTSGTRVASIAAVVAMITGFAGPFVFGKIALDFRKGEETQELANVSGIALAARQYASDNGGVYPLDLATLLEQNRLDPALLHSPYELSIKDTVPTRASIVTGHSHAEILKYLEEHSDYQYFGGDLRLSVATTRAADGVSNFDDILVVSRQFPIERINLSIAFADGHAQFINLEGAEATVKKTNAIRSALGFAAMHPPTSVEKAVAQENADHSPPSP